MMPDGIRSYSRYLHHALVGAGVLVVILHWFLPLAHASMAFGALADLAVAAIAAGLTVYGFSVLHEKRVIEDTPSSRVRSVAMGIAELVGTAREAAPLASPLTQVPCVYYRYKVEEERSSGRNKEWVTIEDERSIQPFYLEDETGRILVIPESAETILRRAFREVRRDGGLLGARRRYTEWRLIPGQRICVVGTVKRSRDVAGESRAALASRLQALKRDADRLRRFDTDGDGQISGEEWDAAVASVKDDMARDEMARPASDPEDDRYIGHGSDESTFVIADRGEASLARSLGIRAFAALAFGPLLLVAVAVSLLARSGALPARWAIPWESLG
jgi:hypothetical protein